MLICTLFEGQGRGLRKYVLYSYLNVDNYGCLPNTIFLSTSGATKVEAGAPVRYLCYIGETYYIHTATTQMINTFQRQNIVAILSSHKI